MYSMPGRNGDCHAEVRARCRGEVLKSGRALRAIFTLPEEPREFVALDAGDEIGRGDPWRPCKEETCDGDRLLEETTLHPDFFAD